MPINAIEIRFHDALKLHVCTLIIGNQRARGLGDTPEDALAAATANAEAAERARAAGLEDTVRLMIVE
jgi:hypothetical protein